MNDARKQEAAPDRAPVAAHSIELSQLASDLGSDIAKGLDPSQISGLRSRFGANQLAQAPPVPMWKRFLGQFKEIVIWILIVAAIIAAAMGEAADAIAILAIVLLNGIVGFIQEEKAEQALAALRKLSSPNAKVVRGGKGQQIPAAEILPGDYVELEAGDYVPADARLLSAASLQTQEAALTGESSPVDKDPDGTLPEQTPLAERRNMVYSGTVVTKGKAAALVVATAMQTELGHIAGLLARQPQEPTPLQRRLAELGRVLVFVCLALVSVVFVLQLVRGGELLQVFLVSVSLAVAAVPEGLPAVVTLALALGLQRMAARNALVRKLPSVETLGSVTVICTDKTGTLTRNEMTVRRLVAGDEEFEVTGSGYQPEGEFRAGEAEGQAVKAADHPGLRMLLSVGVRCNGARLDRGQDGQSWQVIGDPTEGALLVAAGKAGLPYARDDFQVVSEIPFDSNRKAMSVIVREKDGSELICTKGAPEVVLEMCHRELREGRDQPLDDKRREAILRQNAALADKALRVLALAYRQQQAGGPELAERELVLAGLAGMLDPPRDEARVAVQSCQSAGIRPVMITGDHPATARAIARDLGILNEGDKVASGQELQETSDETLTNGVHGTSVYARVSAEHKLRIVRAWQRRGEVAAMTGDGVNDAPAVKAADIGIAMGITGSDVTKEASDMVLTDDNFRSIVSAVEEGRCIFDNVRNIVHYLLSCNAGEVLFMFFAALVGWQSPLAAIQILWINLVTDGLPALALAMERPDRDVMQRAPRPPHEPVLTRRRGRLILTHGLLVAAATTVGFWLVYGGSAERLDEARTVAFCILAFGQLFFAFACRSEQRTLPELGPFSNPYLLGAIAASGLLQLAAVTLPFARSVLKVEADLTSGDWLLVALLALAPVTAVEVTKLVRAALHKAPG